MTPALAVVSFVVETMLRPANRRWLIGVAASAGVMSAAVVNATPARPSLSAPLAIRTDRAEDGRGLVVDFAAVVAAPVDAVARVLADVGAYADWVPRMKSARALPQGDGADQLFESTMGLPWPLGDVRALVAMRRDPRGPGVRLSWQQIRGDFRRYDGSWRLVSLAPGYTQVRYQAHFQFRSWVPAFLVRIAQRHYAPWFLENLRLRAVQQPPPATALVPRKHA